MKLLINFKKNKKITYKKIDSSFNLEPSRHWKILFNFGAVILIVFIFASWYLYSRFDRSDEIVDTSDGEVKVESFNLDNVKKIEDYFKKKKENFDILQTIPPIVSDPLLYQ
jgi:hypothetical protein